MKSTSNSSDSKKSKVREIIETTAFILTICSILGGAIWYANSQGWFAKLPFG